MFDERQSLLAPTVITDLDTNRIYFRINYFTMLLLVFKLIMSNMLGLMFYFIGMCLLLKGLKINSH